MRGRKKFGLVMGSRVGLVLLLLSFVSCRTGEGTVAPHLWAIGFVSQGRTLVTAGAQGPPRMKPRHGELIFWSATTAKKKRIVREEWGLRSLAVAPDGKYIAIGDAIGQTKLVNPETGKIFADLTPHSSVVNGIAISADSQLIAGASFDGTIFLWNASGVEQATLACPNEEVNCVAISPASQLVVGGTRTGKLFVFDLPPHGAPQILEAALAPAEAEPFVETIAFSPDGRRFVSGCQTNLRVWDAGTRQLVRVLQPCPSPVNGAMFSPDGQRLAVVDSEGTLALWNAETGERLMLTQAHAGPSFGVAYSPDGRKLATAGVRDFKVKIWDSQTLAPIAEGAR
jgi:WD40 repeat protein